MVFHRDVCAFGFGGKPCRKLRVDPPPPPPAQTTSPSNSWNASWAAFGSQHECCPHFAVSSQFFFFFLNQLAVCSLSLSLSQRSHGLITGTSPAARGAGAHHQHELHTHVVLPGHRERCFASAKTPYCDDGLWPLHRCDAGWDREQCGWIKTRIKQLWWEVAWDCGTQYQRRRTACGADRTNALRPFYTRKGPCAPVGWQYVRYTFSLNHLFFVVVESSHARNTEVFDVMSMFPHRVAAKYTKSANNAEDKPSCYPQYWTMQARLRRKNEGRRGLTFSFTFFLLAFSSNVNNQYTRVIENWRWELKRSGIT